MSRALISLLAVALLGTASAQGPAAPLDALEMDVLEPGEKPEEALERMSARARQQTDTRTPADAAVLEERPRSPAAFGTAPLSPSEPRDLLPKAEDRAQDHRRERERDARSEGRDKARGHEKDRVSQRGPGSEGFRHRGRDGKGDKGERDKGDRDDRDDRDDTRGGKRSG